MKIAVIGLGYVGLPLARLFSTKYQTIGFDMNQKRVESLMGGHDTTLEVADVLLQSALDSGFKCTSNLEDIRDCNFYVIAVPTPVDRNNRPDLTPLISASETVGKVISKGDIVVYESTVYPGVTEEECLPVVERVSGLKFNLDFFAGYSPERINPGDKEHTVEKIKKVTSGSTPEIADIVDKVYNSVLINGTHKAPSIRVAEASKIIENSQRDVNIAFMNAVGVFGASAYGIISYSFMFFRMLFTGLSQGIQPIVSFNYGRKNLDRVKKMLIFAHKITFGASIASLIIIFFLATPVVRIFTHDAPLVVESAKGFILYSIALSFLGFNFVNIAYLQAVDRPMFSNVICMSRSFLFVFIGLVILPKLIGVNGIWLALPFADFMTAILTIPFMKKLTINYVEASV